MPLSPDDDLMTPGPAPVLKPMLSMLLLEAFRLGCDLNLACELAGAVADKMAFEPATPRSMLRALNLLALRVEERRSVTGS